MPLTEKEISELETLIEENRKALERAQRLLELARRRSRQESNRELPQAKQADVDRG